jgi:CPA1 family monovalent cation:H+ antiporter
MTIIALRRHMEDPLVESTISLLTPFAAYLPADLLGASGALAAVTAGLYIGRRGPAIISSSTRLVSDSIWAVLTFLLNGLSFILIGLQLQGILSGLVAHSIAILLWRGVAICLAVIVIRMVWVVAVGGLARLLDHFGLVSRPLPSARQRVVIAWAGMRGVVSLATAMALPLTINHGPFPHRDLLVYLTFCVIFATLVLQGLSLPRLIHWLGLADDGSAAREEAMARLAAAQAALNRLNILAADGTLPAGLVENFRRRFTIRAQRLQAQLADTNVPSQTAQLQTYFEIRHELMEVERRTIIGMRNRDEISDTVLRRIQRDLDLEEVQLLHGQE